MKTLSELSKITGIARQRLTEFREAGLLPVAEQTIDGHYLYDDSAADLLIVIQLLLECGYTRTEIKKILYDDQLAPKNLFEEGISKLEEKCHQLNGTINTLKMYSRISDAFAIPGAESLEMFHSVNVFRDQDFLSGLNQTISAMADIQEPDSRETKYWTLVGFAGFSIGLCHKLLYDSDETERRTDLFVNDMLELLSEDDAHIGITKAAAAEKLVSSLEEMLSDDAVVSLVEAKCGEGSQRYILDSVKRYRKKLYSAEEKDNSA